MQSLAKTRLLTTTLRGYLLLHRAPCGSIQTQVSVCSVWPPAMRWSKVFFDAMASIVFPAFGMNHTFFKVPEALKENYAWGYREGKPVRVDPGLMDEQAYGVKTTASDMVDFVQGNIDPSAVRGPMQHAVEKTHVGFFRAGPVVQGLG
jgi:hypothetical protein